MEAAVLMLLPCAPIIHRVHPFSPLSFEWGWKAHSCPGELQLQQLARSEEQRKPETTRSPEPIVLLLSTRHHNGMGCSLEPQASPDTSDALPGLPSVPSETFAYGCTTQKTLP